MWKKIVSEISGERFNLRSHTQEVRQGGVDIENKKEDYMALTGIFIAEAWKPIYTWAQAHDWKLPNRKVVDGQMVFGAMPDEQFAQDKVPEEIIEKIRSEMIQFTEHSVVNWQKEMEEKCDSAGPMDADEEKKLEQYRLLKTFVEAAGKDPDVAAHIENGIGTATNVIMNVFKVIPLLYRDTHRPHTISTEKMREIAQESKKLILVLASMGVEGFVKLEEVLGSKRSGGRDNYDFTKFKMVEKQEGDKKRLSITLDEQVLMKLKEQVREKQITTGCPALAVDGPSGRNIILEYFDWIYAIADTHLFPLYDKIIERRKKL